MNDSNKHALQEDDTALANLKQELERVIIKVNYHFQSGYERHVNLQTPESIFLNFLKKEITVIPAAFIYRICKKDFILTMQDGFVTNLSFNARSYKYDWNNLDYRLSLLAATAKTLDYKHLKSISHTLDKFYQVMSKSTQDIQNFSFK